MRLAGCVQHTTDHRWIYANGLRRATGFHAHAGRDALKAAKRHEQRILVLEADDSGGGRGILGFRMHTDGAHWDKLYVPGGCSASFPYFTPEMYADNRTLPVVEGRQVFRLATTAMPEIVREVLAEHELGVEDVSLLLMHQANLRINEAVQKHLGLGDERVYNNIQRYGNTTAATLPLVYHEAKARGRVREGDLVVFTALGAGLHWGAGLLRA